MKFDSPLFDRIRVKPDRDRRRHLERPGCNWPGCTAAADHRAPKGRMHEGEYWHFCLEHVREYNQSYNYFAGMSEDAVARFQKDAVTGHRPTWRMGVNGKPHPASHEGGAAGADGEPFDPLGIFSEFGGRARPQRERPDAAATRVVRNAERKALDELGLDADASAPDIKNRFKALVKRHHPDVNGGDRGNEDKLRDIIQAYNYLKSVRRC